MSGPSAAEASQVLAKIFGPSNTSFSNTKKIVVSEVDKNGFVTLLLRLFPSLLWLDGMLSDLRSGPCRALLFALFF